MRLVPFVVVLLCPPIGSAAVDPSAGRSSDVLNVRDFGAFGNGVADDTAPIQAAIDAAISSGDPRSASRTAIKPVYVPPGVYRVTSPLRVRSVQGFTFRGAGQSSRLVADAVGMEAVLDLNGTAYSNIGDFMVAGTERASATRAVWVRWTGTGRSSTHNTFSRVTVINLKYERAAFEIGDASTATGQVDTTAWYFCTAAGARTSGGGDATSYQSGFLIGSGAFGNNLLHHFYGCNATHNRWGVNLAASQMLWSGGIVQSNDVDFLTGTTTYCAIKGVRSEDSLRLLETGGPAAFPSTVSVEDVNWRPEKLNADGYIVRWKYGGSLRLASIQVAMAAGKVPKILIETASAVTLHLDGYATSVPLASLIDVRLGATLRTLVSGFTQMDINGAATNPTIATDSLDFYTAGSLRTIGGKIFGIATDVIGTDRAFVASATGKSGISLSDGGAGRIETHGGNPRPLRLLGWSEFEFNGKATISGRTGYPVFAGHRMEWSATAPTSGTWAQGDIVWNAAAKGGTAPGWVCTENGTPGEWTPMAPLPQPDRTQ